MLIFLPLLFLLCHLHITNFLLYSSFQKSENHHCPTACAGAIIVGASDTHVNHKWPQISKKKKKKNKKYSKNTKKIAENLKYYR